MKKKKIITAAIVILAIIVTIVVVRKLNRKDSADLGSERLSSLTYEESYKDYLTKNGYSGVLADSRIDVDISDFSVDALMQAEIKDGKTFTGEEGKITFSFECSEAGFYNLKLTYLPTAGTTSDIQRRILIDGEQCYDALSQILFKRQYRDEEIKTKNKNEIRPGSEEIFEERTVYIEDYGRRNGEPLLLFLSEGAHTVTFESAKEPMAICALSFEKRPVLPSYSEAIGSLMSTYGVYSGEALTGEAERTEGITESITKSSSSININKNYSDAELSPYHPYHILYNTIGGDSFKISGDYVTWEINAPETGLYYITFKGRQSAKRGVTSYRRMYVNGVVPYAEADKVSFNYSGDMKNYTVGTEDGEPMLFLLNKGSNTVTLEVVLGDFGAVLTEVEESMFNLNRLYLKTVTLTGTAPSKYIDYEIRKKIDGFADIMSTESDRLVKCLNEMVYITGEKGENTTLLEKMAIEAAELAKDPESVTEELSRWKSNISALGTWAVNISEMPLELDSILLSGNTEKLPEATAGFMKNAYYDVIRFFASFVVKTNEVTSSEEYDAKDDDVLVVWMVSSGKEQAQVLQNMIDEQFIPNYDIPVKLQLIPLGVVLRAALTGNGPDVLVGVGQGTLADFAMRNALVDISELPGFEQEADRFYESAITGASYMGGVYGLPETQNFMMTFYRKDVLDSLGVEVPKTWEEIRALIPILQRNNYDFYMPKTEIYSSMVFQYGGDFYLGKGKDYGIASGLTDPVAMEAFKNLTDFFTTYKLLVSADFSNRFRTGEMPVGITNYTTYCNLEIFAPEIKGLWSFAPFPGTEKEDGTIDNTFVTDTTQSVILNSTDHKDAAWTFLKWWTGTEAQLQYATKVESVMGTAARYAAADKEVLASLPWSASEYRALASQLEHTKGIPAVPGSYMTTRMVTYAFDDVVSGTANPRETLYLNVKAIDKELSKKRAEFGIGD
jgi:ABC-type glycerol-3-phosphate transport system substrate-binding protein